MKSLKQQVIDWVETSGDDTEELQDAAQIMKDLSLQLEIMKDAHANLCKMVVDAKATLRDKFAMAALSGQMALVDDRIYPPDYDGTVADWRDWLYLGDAKYCYAMADAMLEARKVQP